MKSRRRSRLNSWLLPALAVGMVAAWRINRPAVALSDATLAAFEADLETAMQTFQMPGAAVALVLENDIVYAWGFGLRDPHSKPTVSPHTQFRIASSTERASTARSRRGGLETRMRPGRY
jgi:CubicO group peptidase (beta-lactamase class C family)